MLKQHSITSKTIINMKSLWTILLITSIISQPLFATETGDFDYSISTIPEELLQNVDAVVRQHNIHFAVSNPQTASEKVLLAVTILNEDSDLNALTVFYDKFSKVKNVRAKIFDAQGKLLKKLSKKDVQDISASDGVSIHDDSRYKYLEASEQNYPYTVEFTYQVNYKGLRYYPDWSILPDYRTSVQYSSYNLVMTKGLVPRYKNYNIDIEPNITRSKDKTAYSWTTKNIKSIDYGRFSPKNLDIFPMVRIQPTRFKVAGYEGNMSTWKLFGKFIYKLNQRHDNLPTEMVKTVKKLTRNASSDAEKVAILYKYLQENHRYVSIQLGIGGWQTYDAKYVYDKKYGDCKALSYYMKSMLKEVGITAYPALIYGGDKDKGLDAEFSTAIDFNHVILFVPQEENDGIWLECTSSDKPYNYLGSFTENRYALLITPSGGELVKTPQKNHKKHLQINIADVEIAPKGSAQAWVSSIKYEQQHDIWRSAFHHATKKQQEKYLHRTLSLPSFEINNLDLKPYDDAPRADVLYDLNIHRFAKRSGRRIFMTPNLLNKASYIPSGIISNQQHSIERRLGYTDIDTITYTLPPNFVIESLPHDNFELSSDFGKYHIEIITNENELIYIRHVEMYAFSFPKERYQDLKDFYTQIVKTDAMKVVLVEKR
jgi:hypothetical protein